MRAPMRAGSGPVLTSNRSSPVAMPVPSALTNASLRTQTRKNAVRCSASGYASIAATSTAEKNRRAMARQSLARFVASTSMPVRATLSASTTSEPAWERLKSMPAAAGIGRPCAPMASATSASVQPSRRARTRRTSQRPAVNRSRASSRCMRRDRSRSAGSSADSNTRAASP